MARQLNFIVNTTPIYCRRRGSLSAKARFDIEETAERKAPSRRRFGRLYCVHLVLIEDRFIRGGRRICLIGLGSHHFRVALNCRALAEKFRNRVDIGEQPRLLLRLAEEERFQLRRGRSGRGRPGARCRRGGGRGRVSGGGPGAAVKSRKFAAKMERFVLWHLGPLVRLNWRGGLRLRLIRRPGRGHLARPRRVNRRLLARKIGRAERRPLPCHLGPGGPGARGIRGARGLLQPLQARDIALDAQGKDTHLALPLRLALAVKRRKRMRCDQDFLAAPMRGSAPRSSLAIFSRWRMKISTAIKIASSIRCISP